MGSGRVQVRQHTIPGVGHRLLLHLPGWESVAIVVDARTGDRELSVLAEPTDEAPRDGVRAETVALGPALPLLG